MKMTSKDVIITIITLIVGAFGMRSYYQLHNMYAEYQECKTNKLAYDSLVKFKKSIK